MATTTETLRNVIIDDLRWPGDRRQLTDDYRLIDNEVIDSLGVFEIVTFIESHYGIEIADDELVPENFETLAAIAALVQRTSAADRGNAIRGGGG